MIFYLSSSFYWIYYWSKVFLLFPLQWTSAHSSNAPFWLLLIGLNPTKRWHSRPEVRTTVLLALPFIYILNYSAPMFLLLPGFCAPCASLISTVSNSTFPYPASAAAASMTGNTPSKQTSFLNLTLKGSPLPSSNGWELMPPSLALVVDTWPSVPWVKSSNPLLIFDIFQSSNFLQITSVLMVVVMCSLECHWITCSKL